VPKSRTFETVLIVVHGLRTWGNENEALESLQFVSALGIFDDWNWNMVKVIVTEPPPQSVEAFTRVGAMLPL
jgi:hypothetical protein